MRLHRFIGNFDLDAKTLAVEDGELLNQWRNVLRLKTADQLTLCDGAGREALATIVDMDKKSVTLSIEEVSMPEREGHKKAELFCALLKRENFELVCQKATELGISRIVPLLTERTVKTGFNRERLEKIIREASEQSGRTTLPELAEPIKFEKAIETIDPKNCVLFDLSGSAFDFKKMDPGSSPGRHEYVSAFIGPEGGFTETEVSLARDKGCIIASLGSLTLRGETAAIVVSYLATQ